MSNQYSLPKPSRESSPDPASDQPVLAQTDRVYWVQHVRAILADRSPKAMAVAREALQAFPTDPELQMLAALAGLAVLSDGEQMLMNAAIAEAKQGFAEGGVPIGSALARGNTLLVSGRNRRVQLGDPIAHGEMDCLRAAGRLKTYKDLTLYTTLSPCMMCSGTIVQFKIGKVIIGENQTFGGNEDFLRSRGVEVVVLNDPACIDLMSRFQKQHPDIWNEDIAE